MGGSGGYGGTGGTGGSGGYGGTGTKCDGGLHCCCSLPGTGGYATESILPPDDNCCDPYCVCAN
jgi:hypothetical protein